jgi:hypothetical protein
MFKRVGGPRFLHVPDAVEVRSSPFGGAFSPEGHSLL